MAELEAGDSQQEMFAMDPEDESLEKLLQKYQDSFKFLQAKQLFLRSTLRDDEETAELTECSSKLQHVEDVSSKSVDAAAVHEFKQMLIHNCVTSSHLTELINSPPDPKTDSPLLCSSYERLKDRLNVLAKQNHELVELSKELEESHLALLDAQTKCHISKEKLKKQLQGHSVEKDLLVASGDIVNTVRTQELMTRQLERSNIIRRLLVMLISNNNVDLLKNRDLANVLFEYSTPITLKDIRN